MKSEWKECSLGDVIDIKHGYAFKSEHFVDGPTQYVLVTPGNFAVGGGFQEQSPKFYDGPITSDYILKSGDLVVTMTDLSKAGDTLGYGAIIPPNSEFAYLHNQRIGFVKQKDNSTDLKYLSYLLRMPDYRRWVVGSATGSTVKHTSPSRIQAHKFPIPPLPEQKAIAQVLAGFDDKIELNRRMNATLEAMAQTLFRAWFVDFEPVKAKAARVAPVGLDAETAALFPSELVASTCGMIPQGWEVSTIGEETRVVGGGTPSTKNPDFWNEGSFAWATPKDLSNLECPVLLDTERKISQMGLENISSGLLPKGTVLLSSRAPIGYLAISETPVAINQGFIAMVCEAKLSNYYTLLWARDNLAIIQSRANGSTFQEISKANFRPLPILVPPSALLNSFQSQIEPVYRSISANLRESRTLAQLRDSLLPRLIAGQLRVES